MLAKNVGLIYLVKVKQTLEFKCFVQIMEGEYGQEL